MSQPVISLLPAYLVDSVTNISCFRIESLLIKEVLGRNLMIVSVTPLVRVRKPFLKSRLCPGILHFSVRSRCLCDLEKFCNSHVK